MTGKNVVTSRIEAALSRIDVALDRLQSVPAGNPAAETELAALRTLHGEIAARLDVAIARLDAAVAGAE